MNSSRRFGLFRTGPSHDERQGHKTENKQAEKPERIHKAKDIRLKVDLGGKLRERAMRSFICARAHGLPGFGHCIELAFKEGIRMVRVRSESVPLDLTLARDEVVE